MALRGDGGDSGRLKNQPVTKQNAVTTDQHHPPAAITKCKACCPIPQLSRRGQKCTVFFFVCELRQFFSTGNKFNVSSKCI